MEEQLKQLQTTVEEKLKNAVSKDELAAIRKEISEQISAIKTGIGEDELKAAKDDFNEKLKAQWQEVEARLNKPTDKPKTWGETLKSAFEAAGMISHQKLDDGREIDVIRELKEGEKVRIKAAFDMNTANTTADVNTGYQTNWSKQPIELPLSTDMHLIDVFPHVPMAPIQTHLGGLIEKTETDGSGLKTETTAAGDSSFAIATEDFKAFTYGVKFRVHRNMLKTWTYLENRIKTIGIDRLKSKITTFILNSTGDGSSTPYGMGVSGRFTAYDTTLRAGSVVKANDVDVIKNGVLQVEQLEKYVDSIMLNPIDIANIESLKDTDSNTIRQAGLVVDATGKLSYIYGLRVIKNKKVTENTFWLVNSMLSCEIGDKFNFEIYMGYDKDGDFSKGVLTIQPEVDIAIGLGDKDTIVYCSDIAAAAGLLTAPSN